MIILLMIVFYFYQEKIIFQVDGNLRDFTVHRNSQLLMHLEGSFALVTRSLLNVVDVFSMRIPH